MDTGISISLVVSDKKRIIQVDVNRNTKIAVMKESSKNCNKIVMEIEKDYEKDETILQNPI